ncbi:hypothetical protein Tcan_05932 [Toxocara canis]|uniref:Uncharacterized protein n=1 Tax=Toxocara canis TaxID=6265 RepID=A0A0B2VHW0_TOXCA|nr:hypothetical protein Tcan_05932 [Toxocara canis]
MIKDNVASLFVYDGAFDYSGVEVVDSIKDLLQDNVRVEGINASLFSGFDPSAKAHEITLLAAEGKMLKFITGFPEIQLPRYSTSSSAIKEGQLFPQDKFPSWAAMQNYLYSGSAIVLTSGVVSFLKGLPRN